jgi:lipopolysaccharide/colanic/teichoic acid biosynthesis glycosyltransferase
MSDYRKTAPIPTIAKSLDYESTPKEWVKRCFDIVLAAIGLVLTLPFFLLIAVLIKLETAGPVFFQQERVGRGGRRFRMWKFRKMPHDLKSTGPSLTRRYDRRLTAIGQFLERTKLDELPQLLNVLVGNMSIVGPRPELPKFVNHYPEQWQVVLSVKPGIFGPNQLKHRNEAELFPATCSDIEEYYVQHILPKKLAVDAEYARTHGLFSDVWILVRCVLAVLSGVVTWRTLLIRRWQLINFAVLSLAGVASMFVAIQVAGHPPRSVSADLLLVLAMVARPVCLLLFRIPKALATSITADDFLRLWWCGVTGAALIAVGMICLEHRNLSRQILLLDATIYLGFLLMYKLVLYKIYILFIKRQERQLTRRMIATSLILAPSLTFLTMTAWRYFTLGFINDWNLIVVFVLLSSVTWPLMSLLNPILRRRQAGLFFVAEGRTIFLNALIGMVFTAYGALILNERDWSRADLLFPATTYALTMLGIGLWQNHLVMKRVPLSRDIDSSGAKTRFGQERLLVVGSGMQLSAYLAALAEAPDDYFEIVGIISPDPNLRTSMIGGHTVVGHLVDLPEFLAEGDITQVIVLSQSLSPTQQAELDSYCRDYDELVVRVESLPRWDNETVPT